MAVFRKGYIYKQKANYGLSQMTKYPLRRQVGGHNGHKHKTLSPQNAKHSEKTHIQHILKITMKDGHISLKG